MHILFKLSINFNYVQQMDKATQTSEEHHTSRSPPLKRRKIENKPMAIVAPRIRSPPPSTSYHIQHLDTYFQFHASDLSYSPVSSPTHDPDTSHQSSPSHDNSPRHTPPHTPYMPDLSQITEYSPTSPTFSYISPESPAVIDLSAESDDDGSDLINPIFIQKILNANNADK